jgi:hypothetical protein
MDQGDTRSVKIGRGVRQGCCLSPSLFNLCSEYLTKEALENLEDFKSGGQEIRTVKYANDFVLLGKKETMLQGKTGRLIEIVIYYGMEMNVEKPEVMSILRQRSPVEPSTDYGRSKHLENVEYSMIKMIQDAHVKLKRGLSWKKQHTARRTLFYNKLDLNIRKK